MYIRTVDDDEEVSHFTRWVVFALTIALVLVLIVIGFRIFADHKRGLMASSQLESEGLLLQLSMSKTTYKPGETIDIKLVAKNISPNKIKLEFDSGLEFDLVVQSEIDLKFAQIPRSVWQYSANSGASISGNPHSVNIDPGGEHEFKSLWNQRNFKGQLVEPGRYVITGYLLAKNRNERLQLRGETTDKP